MGVYRRQDSPYWWMSGPGIRPQSTRVVADAATKWERERQQRTAEQIYARALERAARQQWGLPVERPPITFDAFADWYAAHVAPKKKSGLRELEMLPRLRQYFGPLELTAVDRARVEEYRTARLATVAPGTVNREVHFLRAILRAAIPTYLETMPLDGLRQLKTVPKRGAVLTPAQEQRVLRELSPVDRALFIVATDTLIRLGDALDVRRDQDHGRYLVIEDSKTGRYEVPVSARARAALDSLEQNGPYYFWARRQAEPHCWTRIVRHSFRRACQRAKVPYGRKRGGVTWHTGTRASGATRMLQAGVDPATVQRIGHWASFDQMGVYLHASPHLQAAVDLIDPARSTSVVRSSETAPKRASSRKQPNRR